MNVKEHIADATDRYEVWLTQHTHTSPDDFKQKHVSMSENEFAFFRATFYRWVQYWDAMPEEVASVPDVLAVGDLHLENFGTWRDSEGRLAWGINDFDEASPLPFTADLLRLATSAILAREAGAHSVSLRKACEEILAGYTAALKHCGHIILLDNNPQNIWLRELAANALKTDDLSKDLKRDKSKNKTLPLVPPPIAMSAEKAIAATVPAGVKMKQYRVQRGLGSLGRLRFRAWGDWQGGLLVREAKAIAPSAAVWKSGGSTKIHIPRCFSHPLRAVDPTIQINGKWLLRGLARDNVKIEASKIKKIKHVEKLLFSMGWETANVHLDTGHAALGEKLRASLKKLSKKGRTKSAWLKDAAEELSKWVKRDFKNWTKR